MGTSAISAGTIAGGAGGGATLTEDVAQVAHGFVVGDWVRLNGASYVKAQADSSANVEIIGVVSAVADVDNFTVQFGGKVEGLSGLVAGTAYFIDASTAGAITATEPSTIGDFSKPVLIADSTTSGYVYNMRGSEIALASAGKVLQVVNVQDGSQTNGTTQIPLDDTIPQNTEGTEFMTLAITPTSATSKLKIEVVFIGAYASATSAIIVALFQDTTANALACAITDEANSDNRMRTIGFTHYMTAGTTSATTFKIRAGATAVGALTFNGASSARRFGGVSASSITITEIAT